MTQTAPEGRSIERLIVPIVGVGVIARLAHYLANRSLWLDEAMISLNIDQRSFGELVGALDFNQAAPLAFLWLEKLSVTVLGSSELSLRLWPLIASIAALVVFAALARRLLPPVGALVAVTLFACSASLTYYAAEVKQYSFDVFFACLLPWLAVRHADRGTGLAALAVAGAAAFWFSHPVVFVLPGVLLYLAMTTDGSLDRARIAGLARVALLWGVSFAAAYLLTARDAARSPLMARFWVEGFMPIPPTSVEDLRWYGDAFLGWMRGVFDFTETDSLLRTAAFVVSGVFASWRVVRGWITKRRETVLMAMPIALALVASAVRIYPFQGRLILFLVPSTVLLIAAGVALAFGSSTAFVAQRTEIDGVSREAAQTTRDRWTRPLGALGAAALLVCSVSILAAWLARPAREELRSVLEYVAERSETGDVVYLHSGAQHGQIFYERTCENCRLGATLVRGGMLSGDEDAIMRDLAALPAGGRVWLVFSHEWWGFGDVERVRMTDELAERSPGGQPSDLIEETGASAYLFDLASP